LKEEKMAAEKICFTVQVFAGLHETHASTLAHVDQVCQRAAQAARAAGGAKLSGVVLADGGAEQIGAWQFQPLTSA
jgi:hypothetical protein